MTQKQIQEFRKVVYSYYRKHGRHALPWRKTRDPYKILVSEVMLQQTQVVRVIPKYKAFLKAFPTVRALAKAPLRDVLLLWQGLGYNRRAKALHKAAQMAVAQSGVLPRTYEGLLQLPGVGPATAAGVAAFAYGAPTLYLETNVRSVFLHHFFEEQEDVSDKDIISLVEETLDERHAREWYYALLDYGVYIKTKHGNPNSRSKHYSIQSPYKNSNRFLRARILESALSGKGSALAALARTLKVPTLRLRNIAQKLAEEGMVQIVDGRVKSV